MSEKKLLSEIQTIVFDLDDVLVNKFGMQNAEDQYMILKHGLLPKDPFEQQKFLCYMTTTRAKDAKIRSQGDPRRYYEILIGKDKLREDFDIIHEESVRYAANSLTKQPGAIELLTKIGESSLKCALLTNRERKLLTPELTAGIITNKLEPRREGYFDLTISASDVGTDSNNKPRLKPSTAGLELIFDYFKIDEFKPHEVVMIGDLPSDITPAKKLGAKAIGIARAKEDITLLKEAGADLVVAEVSHLIPLLPF